MADSKETFAKVCSWFGLIASCFSAYIWIFRLIGSYPTLYFPTHGYNRYGAHSGGYRWIPSFIDSGVNYASYRKPFFSLMPSTLCDAWAPLIIGFIGINFHFKQSPFIVHMFCSSWPVFFAFHLVMSLFCHIAYGGNMGLIISPIGFITALLHFVAIFVCKDYKCNLELEVKCKCDIKKEDDGRNMYAKVTSWFCLIASCLVILVGFFRIFVANVYLSWNPCHFIYDGTGDATHHNSCRKQGWSYSYAGPRHTWRAPLFTFVPDELGKRRTQLDSNEVDVCIVSVTLYVFS
eukprot:GHVU01103360.1.p1 GENE.GHVU01103360.1~~GHVU01103360.1.p1  ORF type:complete len:291 (-),score=11.02 GHVU01103360.1:829-1701(-)